MFDVGNTVIYLILMCLCRDKILYYRLIICSRSFIVVENEFNIWVSSENQLAISVLTPFRGISLSGVCERMLDD